MARVWSVSQGKYVETGGGATTPSPETGGADYQGLQKILLQLGLSNPKNASKYSTLAGMAKDLAPTEKQQEEETKKSTAVKNIELLENLYFNNGLGKGPAGGIMSELEALVNPGSTYKRYKNAVISMRPGFAKLAGDTGNLAVQEQIAQGKLFPTARFSNEDAVEAFKVARQRFSLPERDYSELLKTTGGVSGFASKYE